MRGALRRTGAETIRERLRARGSARRRPRLRRVLVTLALTITVVLTAAALPAFAAVSDIGSAGVFELDGNVARDAAATPPFDWADLFDSAGHRAYASAPLVSSVFVSDYGTPDHSYFTPSKDTQDISSWGCTVQNTPTPKDDILNSYAAVFRPTSGPRAGHLLLYVGSERRQPQGDAFAGFWILKNGAGCTSTADGGTGTFTGAHTTDDMLVLSDYTNGGSVATVKMYQWDPTAANHLKLLGTGLDCGSSSASDDMCGRTNASPVTPPWPDGGVTLAEGTFLEIGIDITAVIGTPTCSSTFLGESRSSQEVTATLKDFGGGPFNICAQPIVTTHLSATTVPAGTPVHDSATLTGATTDASGTVTYAVYQGTACTGTPVFTSTKTVTDGAVPDSDPYTPTVPGTYEWQASYSGDAALGRFNAPGVSECGTEEFTVPKLTPAISTTPSAGGAIGALIHDTATVSGGYKPTGTVTFALYAPGDSTCTGTNLVAGDPAFSDVPLAGGVAVSPSYTTAQVGTYHWVATYNGDAANVSVTSGCADEPVTTSKATPSITTTPSAGGVVGTPIHDTATVSGGHSPTGTVTFALYAPGDTTCTGTNLVGGDSAFSNVPLAGATAVSPDHTTAQAGVYHWVATYNGDAANVSVTSGCADEPVAIGLAQPTIATIQLPRGGGPGAVIHDTATVTGGSDPTGTVTFRLYSPADSTCSGTPAFSDVEPLSGGNATSASTTATATGVYRWVATYNGDARNNVATSGCDEEPVVIVLGVTIHRPLPKTGTPVRSLLVTAVLFMAAGSALLLAGRLRWDPPSVSGMRHAIIAQALVVRGHIGASHRRRWGPPRRAGP